MFILPLLPKTLVHVPFGWRPSITAPTHEWRPPTHGSTGYSVSLYYRAVVGGQSHALLCLAGCLHTRQHFLPYIRPLTVAGLKVPERPQSDFLEKKDM